MSNTEIRKTARSGSVAVIGAGVKAALAFALTLLIAHGLGATGAGMFALAIAVYMTLSVAGRLGTDTAVVRTLPQLLTHSRTRDVRACIIAAVVPVCAVMTLIAAAVWWLAPTIATLFGATAQTRDETAHIIQLIAATLPIATGGYIMLAATRGLGQIKPYILVQDVAKPLARISFVGVALLLATGIYGVTLAWVLATVATSLIAVWTLWRALRNIHPHGTTLPQLQEQAREVWTFALPRSAAQITEIASLHAGIVLASIIGTLADAGVYNAALRLVMAGTLIVQALRVVLAPQISRLIAEGDREQTQRVHHTATAWVVLASWPVYLLMALWPSHVLSLFGREFSAGAATLSVLALAMLGSVTAGNVGTVLLMSGRSKENMHVSLVALAILIGGSLALAPVWAVTSVAVAKALSILWEVGAMTHLVRTRERISTWGRPVWAALAAAMLSFALPALALRVTGVTSVGAVVSVTLLSCIVYCVFLLRWRKVLQLNALYTGEKQRI